MDVKKGYDYDDLLLLPRYSEVNSRDNVDLSSIIGNMELKIPIIGSPMKGIMTAEMAHELSKNGAIGILHKFYDDYKYLIKDITFLKNSNDKFGVAVGLPKNHNVRNIIHILSFEPDIICVDVANGYLSSVIEFVNLLATYIEEKTYKTLVMAGNVVDFEGANDLYIAGASFVRVGIGSGGLCTTRNITGIGCPQLAALEDASKSGAFIISDGGIRNSGDIVKSIAAGADAVMIGSLLAKTKESDHTGTIYGMASRKLQEEYYSSSKSIEGVEKPVEKTTTVKDLIEELSWGLKSACTYLGHRSLMGIYNDAKWVEVGKGTLKDI